MPELPEVENVRLSLGRLVGRRIDRVTCHRRDIITGSTRPAALLAGRTITELLRHGKQLAILTDNAPNQPAGPCLCIHLGMTGSLRLHPAQGSPGSKRRRDRPPDLPPHTHLLWRLEDGSVLAFSDPRRFGSIQTLPDRQALLTDCWSRLGPDALTITPRALHARLSRTRRPLKAALLDQQLVAGLGNIYVDELLHMAGLHPLTPASLVTAAQARALVPRMRRLLGRAIEHGGSTLRNYTDGEGKAGRFQQSHAVYSRSGQPCTRCRAILARLIVSGRSTVFCPACQPEPTTIDRAGTA